MPFNGASRHHLPRLGGARGSGEVPLFATGCKLQNRLRVVVADECVEIGVGINRSLQQAMVILARQIDRALREAKGLDPGNSEAIIIADSTIPYRLFVEVLFTLGQNEFGKYHLMVMQSK